MRCIIIALLANTQLIDGRNASHWAEIKGQLVTTAQKGQLVTTAQKGQLVTTAQIDMSLSTAYLSPATSPDAGELAMSSPALPVEIFQSAKRGELQKVVRWLGKGGPVDALSSGRIRLLHIGREPASYVLFSSFPRLLQPVRHLVHEL